MCNFTHLLLQKYFHIPWDQAFCCFCNIFICKFCPRTGLSLQHWNTVCPGDQPETSQDHSIFQWLNVRNLQQLFWYLSIVRQGHKCHPLKSVIQSLCCKGLRNGNFFFSTLGVNAENLLYATQSWYSDNKISELGKFSAEAKTSRQQCNIIQKRYNSIGNSQLALMAHSLDSYFWAVWLLVRWEQGKSRLPANGYQ